MQADVRKCCKHNVEDCNNQNEECRHHNRMGQVLSDYHQDNGEEQRQSPEDKCGGIHQAPKSVEIPSQVGVEASRYLDPCEKEENAHAADAAEKDAPWKEADQIAEPQQPKEQENDACKN